MKFSHIFYLVLALFADINNFSISINFDEVKENFLILWKKFNFDLGIFL